MEVTKNIKNTSRVFFKYFLEGTNCRRTKDESNNVSSNLRGVLGRSLGGEAAVSRYVEQESAVGGQLPVAGGHENHELSDGRLVEEVLVRVIPLVGHGRPGPAHSAVLLK